MKRRKSYFDDLFSRSMTWEYRGLQGVTGGYQRLQGVTRGSRGVQGVTAGYKGLQGLTGGDKGLKVVTKDYRNFFLTTVVFIVFKGKQPPVTPCNPLYSHDIDRENKS